MTQVANSLHYLKGMAGTTGLEPAASAVTGQRSNQLNYVPTPLRKALLDKAFAGFAGSAQKAVHKTQRTKCAPGVTAPNPYKFLCA
jgi:hypothetical protein